MLNPCQSKADCYPCYESPIENLSSEDEDQIVYRSSAEIDLDPPLEPWKRRGCKRWCESTISQEDADLCAANQAVECAVEGEGEDDDNNPRSACWNTSQTGYARCPDGTVFGYTIAAHTVAAPTCREANQQALSLAQQRADANKVCLSDLRDWICIDTACALRIAAIRGFEPFVFSIYAGTLPTGLAAWQDGRFLRIEGTPTVAGSFDFSVQCVDTHGSVMQKGFTVLVGGITTDTVADGEVGEDYSEVLAQSGGVDPIEWTVIAGALPHGIDLDPVTGELTGAPTTAGIYTFTVQMDDGVPLNTSNVWEEGIIDTAIVDGTEDATDTEPEPDWTYEIELDTTLPDSDQGSPYSVFLSASGGPDGTIYDYSISTGALPEGLEMTDAGHLFGTPTLAGTYAFTVQVTAVNGKPLQQDYTLVVAAPVGSIYAKPSAYWDLDEQTVTPEHPVYLERVGGRNFPYNPLWVPAVGKHNYAQKIKGRYLTVNDESMSVLDIGANSFSVRFWFKFEADDGVSLNRIMESYGSGYVIKWKIERHGLEGAGDELWFTVYYNWTVQQNPDTGQLEQFWQEAVAIVTCPLPRGVWHRLVATRYFDGSGNICVGLKLDDAPTVTAVGVPMLDHPMGESNLAVGGAAECTLDELAFWNGFELVNSAADLAIDWNGGAGKFYPLS